LGEERESLGRADVMVKGIGFLIGLGIVLGSMAAQAQQTSKMYRVGFLGNSTAALEANLVGPFRERLRDLGYVEGRNIVIEYRWAEGKYDRFPALIEELLALKVAVIVTAGTPATLAVKNATSSVPLVMTAVGDPVGTGIVPSLNHPGGNITGLTAISTEMDAKRLELLREVVPGVSYIALLWNAASPLQVLAEKQVQAAARVLHMRVLSLGVQTEDEIKSALAVHLRCLIAQAKPLGEPLERGYPRPELVHLATEVHDGCRDPGPRQPRLLRADQSKAPRDEVVRGRIDVDFG
jgi:ABC-type uncharacterized transport system substrate-binding protein